MLIAEDLLLLLTDDASGKLLAPASEVDIALGGALLVELALSRRIEVSGDDEAMPKGRLRVADSSPTGDPLLDETLIRLGERQGKKANAVVRELGKGLRARLDARLAEQGLLHEETAKILGVVPTHRWPSTDTRHEAALRTELTDALRSGTTSQPREGALISLLHALKVAARVIDPATCGLSKHELNRNAERIADGDWAARAVRDAIDAMLAPVIAATTSASVFSPGT